MSGTVLIVDSVSTNRIICKAKLTAAFYRVFQAETTPTKLFCFVLGCWLGCGNGTLLTTDS